MRSGELFMKLERIIELQEEQLERYKALKMCCDTCIDNEVIEAQTLTIDFLKYYVGILENRLKIIKKYDDLKNIIHRFVATIANNDLIPGFDTNVSIVEIFNQIVEALNEENKVLIR